MKFKSPLIRGKLIKRYKRFLADVVLDTGETVTAACANTGSMLGLTEPGNAVWLSRSESPTRKYPHSWELVDIPDIGLVGINTAQPNHIVTEAIIAGKVAELAGYANLRNEVKYGQNSRIDILLEDPQTPALLRGNQECPFLQEARAWPNFPIASPNAAPNTLLSCQTW